MRFRGGEFSTGTMRNFQPELTWRANSRVVEMVLPERKVG